jgi:HEAT repeat protein
MTANNSYDATDEFAELIDTMLNSPDDFDRGDAAKALGQMGDERVVAPLVQALRDSEDTVRWEAARALSMIGEPAVESLLKLLSDSDSDVRGRAAHALGDIRDTRALAELEHMVREDQGAMLNGTPVAGVAQYAVNNIRNSMT